MIDKALFKLPGLRSKMPFIGTLAILQALVIIGQAFFMSTAITRMWHGKGLQPALLSIGGFALCFLAREVINFFRQRFLDHYAYQASIEMRTQLLDKVFKLGPQVAAEKGSGSLTTTAISGIEDVETYIKLVLSKILNMMIVPMVILVAVIFLDWKSSIVLILTFPISILFMIILGYAAQGRASQQYESYQVLSNHFLDSLRGISTLKYFGRSKEYANSIYHTSERFRTATMRTLRIAILSTFALDFFSTLSVATMALFLGLRLMDGTVTLFPALMALILAPEYFLPLREFASDYHATLNGKNSFQAVQAVLAMDEGLSFQLAAPVFWTDHSKLTLSALTKEYENQRGVKQVSVSIEGMKKVAIVGASGSGKSTLLNLLSGFSNPTSGRFELNNQKEMTSLNDLNWRKSVSFIPQNTYLFSASLRDNLAFYQPDATDEAILVAAKHAELEKLVETLGLDCMIGAGNRTLSGGQMQRIALARAFLSNDRNIILLDEPTAHLDIETELEIKENILPIFENKLVFLATHRLHWLSQMDMIIVLNEGEVKGIGTHETLLNESPYYQQLISEMRG
ncbi:thiol reductant ABC exporter subunit CydD [Lactococcus hircilactis]|uniref:Thiol reductant ABC exporter subunit CydD n=1 Tax=Lactococcus hircilactis TaxID=1494462 RepID=A0A7X1Z811_9LACT|nr:thiol reductant ABC exporter subunit CydD [Lactococcus hircilactis]MQW39387.1 thiol reductant ABC exporter subunit CydD [Lactococcus hircilactis]